MENKLTVAKLEELMSECLYTEEELSEHTGVPPGAIKITGLVRNFALHPLRTKERKPRLDEMLKELPNQFSDGGGWTFLNMPTREGGEQWGEQHHAEALMVLGLAVGSIKYCMPREFWSSLPGSVPYIQVVIS